LHYFGIREAISFYGETLVRERFADTKSREQTKLANYDKVEN